MAANTSPIYVRKPDITVAGAITGTNANTATDGTGANMYQIFAADATEGSFVNYVRFIPVSTVAATVVRLWVCSATGTFTAGTTNTAANTTRVAEQSVAAWTASNTAAAPVYDIPLNMPLNAGFKLLVSYGTSTGAATTGFNPLTVSGDY